jgi:hypothetical protein
MENHLFFNGKIHYKSLWFINDFVLSSSDQSQVRDFRHRHQLSLFLIFLAVSEVKIGFPQENGDSINSKMFN